MSRYLEFEPSMEMLKALYDAGVERVAYTNTPLYGWALRVEGLPRLGRRILEEAGMYEAHAYEGVEAAGCVEPAGLWKRDDGKRMCPSLFGLDEYDVDAEPLDLNASGLTWDELFKKLDSEMVRRFDEALSRSVM